MTRPHLKIVEFTKQVDDPASRIEDLLRTSELQLRRAFEGIVQQLQDERTLGEIADLIEQGNIQRALETAARAGARFAASVNGVYIRAGEDVAETIGEGLSVIVSFDQTNFRAVSQMQQANLRIIREFTEQQRAATGEALVEGVRRGLNPREQARAFRGSIGLTQRQVQAVNNYRRLLEELSLEALTRRLRDRRFDATLRRAVRTGQPLTREQIDRMVERYRERSLKFRSETIARTEALRSVNEGTEEMFRQAIDAGAVDPDRLVRQWNTAADERVRASHSTMDGQQRPFGEPFISGNGNNLRHPGDINAPASETINCRCVLSTRLDAPPQ